MIVLALWIVCTAFVLILVFTALGMPFAAAWALVSPRKQRFCLQCHSTDALRWPYVCKVCRSKKTISAAAPIAAEFADHSTEMPICTRCGSRNVEGARFCGNCGVPVSAAAIPNPPVWTGPPPPPVFPKPGISRAVWRFIGWGSAIAVVIFILLVVIGTLLPSPPNQSGASQPSVPQPAPPQPVHGTVSKYGMTLCPTQQAYDGYRSEFGLSYKADSDRDYSKADKDVDLPEDAISLDQKLAAEDYKCTEVPAGTPAILEGSFTEELDPQNDPYLTETFVRVSVSMPDGTTLAGFADNDAFTKQ